jgi:hypothetical protein
MALKGRAVKRDLNTITFEHATAQKCSVHSGSRTNSNNSTHANTSRPDMTKGWANNRAAGVCQSRIVVAPKTARGWVSAYIDRDVERGETVRSLWSSTPVDPHW